MKYKVLKEVTIPKELVQSVETIDFAIDSLKLHKKMLEGKTINSERGIINKIKFYFLGYALITPTTLEGMLPQ